MTTLGVKTSWLKCTLTLILAIVHIVAGLSILMVASWFIAACSIAGLGFNYMLPAVVIRALALIRIASGYFYMLVGHNDLLERIATIRLRIFSGLKNKSDTSRSESLDALSHHSEEVASIWITWVSQNAGAVLSIVILNIVVASLIPVLTWLSLGFSVAFFALYGFLLLSLVHLSAEITQQKRNCQMRIIQHIETASVWHLYRTFEQQVPLMQPLRELESRTNQRIRIASTILFIAAIITLTSIFAMYSVELAGNVIFIVLPMALLSINDWLSPTLSNQRQLLSYWQAKRAITDLEKSEETLSEYTDSIEMLSIKSFKPENTRMDAIDASFKQQSTSVLVGSSGAGKSRLLQAIQGLLPFEGEKSVSRKHAPILLSPVMPNALFTNCLYIEQFPHILSDTLRANLLIANTNRSDEELLCALEKVGLGYFDNLEIWLGDSGLPLSGGERKRIGLARAILSNTSVLLLDEPFESLDSDTMGVVVNVINELSFQHMVIVATHVIPEELDYHQLLSLDDSPTSLSSNYFSVGI